MHLSIHRPFPDPIVDPDPLKQTLMRRIDSRIKRLEREAIADEARRQASTRDPPNP